MTATFISERNQRLKVSKRNYLSYKNHYESPPAIPHAADQERLRVVE
jgi:hypothetical protein